MALRKKLEPLQQNDYASLKCQCGRHIIAPCAARAINNSAGGCDVMGVTEAMRRTGELQQEANAYNTLKHRETCFPLDVPQNHNLQKES